MVEEETPITLKDKLNWKELFYEQSRLCRKYATQDWKGSDQQKWEMNTFHLWYNLIPDYLKDEDLDQAWRETIEKDSIRSEDWIELYHAFWNWAYRHSLVLSVQEYDKDETILDKAIHYVEARDFERLWDLFFIVEV